MKDVSPNRKVVVPDPCDVHPVSVGIKWARVRIVAGDDLLRIRQLSGTGVP